jgi:hypothetical protein
MKLTEIFHALEYGELSTQTSLVETVTGVLPENYNKVISFINLGLANIHEKLNVKLGDAYILMLDGVAEYYLDSKYAFSNPNGDPDVRYILDSPATPYKNNAIKILEAFTEIGEPLPINDRTEEKSVFTPSQLSIQIPWKVAGDVINIVYRAAPDLIILSEYDDIGDIEVDLPRTYLEPLLYYIAYQHFAGVGGQSGTPTSLGYFQKYQARMQEIEFNGVPNKDLSASTDFQKGGWV